MTKSTAESPRDVIARYVAIARPDHWVKNVFMLPGVALAYLVDDHATLADLRWVVLGFASTCLVASANYTINEYLDAAFDRMHPTKSKRPSAQGLIDVRFMLLQYGLLCAVGLLLASFLNPMFFFASILLLVMGVLYNVSPIRTKDRTYLDVLSESVNNPIRLVLGWAAISTIVLPPVSMILCYWMGGAYLMAIKRFAEYRMIDDPERAGLYRRSFRFYTEESLLISAFFYALSSALFLGIFLIKYKVEFILSFPFFALLFAWYLRIALQSHSTAINPEKLYTRPKFLGYVVALTVLMVLLLNLDLPGLEKLDDHTAAFDIRIQ